MADSLAERKVTADDTCHTVNAVRTRSQTKQAEAVSHQITQSEDLSLPDTLFGQVTDKVAVDKPSNDESNAEVASASQQQILDEQQTDATLTGWHKLTQQGSLGLHYRNGLLYRSSKLFGRDIDQLVLPENRRKIPFDLAYFTSHLGVAKVTVPLNMTFTWPTIKRDVKKWTEACTVCQQKRRVTYLNRVPIRHIRRSELPFYRVSMDCFGPLFPGQNGQKAHFNYALVVVDLCTRFPFCYPSLSLAAKQVCDRLIEMFSLVGVPAIVPCDNATNFSGHLTS